MLSLKISLAIVLELHSTNLYFLEVAKKNSEQHVCRNEEEHTAFDMEAETRMDTLHLHLVI